MVMVKQDERTDPAALGKAIRQAEAAMATNEPWDPAVTSGLRSYPPAEQWDDWVELDPKAWPERVERRYAIVPTICFNCEAACGLLAYVDKETLRIRKLEGNPLHPGSRGRNCAKGPATVNQVYDPDRILYPMKRAGERGSGQWVRTTWDEVLDDIAGRIRTALLEDRHNEIMYHVGRPGEDGYMEKVLQSWGIDGHNSHTNVCSAGARFGYASWMGIDRPSPDHANAKFILLISSHLETGHYFNPHAQRIMEGKMAGAKLAVMDPRLSNTASMADHWLPTWPGSEPTVLLAMAKVILDEGGYDREYIRRWVNWETYLRAERPDLELSVDSFIEALRDLYADYTPERAEEESGVPAKQIVEIARQIADAGSRLATHNWRSASAGNLGGWQVARCLFLLNVLTGSVGTAGGTSPNAWDKFVPTPWNKPGPQSKWNEIMWPKEYPLAHHEMSFLMPHLMRDAGPDRKMDVYFTRVYNPVWTNPDGFSWIEMLTDEKRIGQHIALTPTWNETAWYADYVLPMGLAPERHDNQSQETHASRWFGFRQPVVRVAMEKMGQKVDYTWQANPGEVWEEDEFFIELSWRIDPDGDLGIRQHYESPYRPGEKITVEEHYRWMFENTVPGLPEKAAEQGLTPLEYMRRYGAFEVEKATYNWNEKAVFPDGAPADIRIDPASHLAMRGLNGSTETVGVEVDGEIYAGFPTPSKKLEFYSETLRDWRWPEYTLPGTIDSHVARKNIDFEAGEMLLLPNFRLPTIIHTRSANAKWLYEISHTNPAWVHPKDAARLNVATGDLIRVETQIGHFVAKVWVTEGIRPGIVACSHHMGRWRLGEPMATGEPGSGTLNRIASAKVEIEPKGDGKYDMHQIEGVKPFESDDPDTMRVWWGDAGVNQNLTFPVQPDPISGQHCWHQHVKVTKAAPTDRYGDIHVDLERSRQVYEQWKSLTRPAPGPNNLRRPLWYARPYKPTPEMFVLAEEEPEEELAPAD